MTSHQVQMLLVGLAVIFLLARVLGALARRAGQPAVVGEICAGILLGPTLFGGVLSDALFPADVRPALTALADVGLVLFMFFVGLETDTGSLRGRGRAAAGGVIGSIAVPMLMGAGLGLLLLRAPIAGDVPAGPFAVFIGLVLAVTAFPVLARILEDRGLFTTAVGGIALAVAAAIDVAVWGGLAAVQAWVGGDGTVWLAGAFALYLVTLAVLVRPLLRRFLTPDGLSAPLTPTAYVVLLAGALLSAAATEAMGMHFILGAFLFGLAMPRKGAATLHADLADRLGGLTSVLLPVYFVVAGLRVDLGALGLSALGFLLLILSFSVLGKVGGTYLGLRTQGMPARPSMALTALLSTRGLTDLVVLGVGLQIGLLGGELYSLLVVVVLITTLSIGPLLTLIYRKPVEIPAGARASDSEGTVPEARTGRSPSAAADQAAVQRPTK
ncbi:cation:proton antiporter [Actinomadura sp. WMMB 499]|uniref:cation:proton antiporter n=1 Tax=Actinomadura sp. WMMB 499 TaxID=1219491 RepID=UPI0012443FDF|nr:cation:proton antiporter [Actinomadura sp. WMMB 499]QFG24778.1 cation/H(+) antiporter [Actinomadura sp. WMMB 499]